MKASIPGWPRSAAFCNALDDGIPGACFPAEADSDGSAAFFPVESDGSAAVVLIGVTLIAAAGGGGPFSLCEECFEVYWCFSVLTGVN